jgi:hypothetical protein
MAPLAAATLLGTLTSSFTGIDRNRMESILPYLERDKNVL